MLQVKSLNILVLYLQIYFRLFKNEIWIFIKSTLHFVLQIGRYQKSLFLANLNRMNNKKSHFSKLDSIVYIKLNRKQTISIFFTWLYYLMLTITKDISTSIFFFTQIHFHLAARPVPGD